MKTQFFLKAIMVITFITAISLSGCKKEETDSDQRAAIDNATAENAFSDVFKQVDNAAKQTAESGSEKSAEGIAGGYPIITISPAGETNWPKTLTVDFGPTNILCSDGKLRRGKIISELSGKYKEENTVIKVTLDNFYVNNNHVEGTKTITNLGHVGTTNGGNNLKYSIVVKDGKVTTSEGVATWNSTREREWIAGENTKWPNWQDDVFLITGSASGTTIHGNSYTITITKALQVAHDCKWVESGTLEIAPEGKAIRTVDFGNGDCDNQASVTINGVTYYFTMN